MLENILLVELFREFGSFWIFFWKIFGLFLVVELDVFIDFKERVLGWKVLYN